MMLNGRKNKSRADEVDRHVLDDKVTTLGRTKIVAIITLIAVVMAVGIAYTLICLFAGDGFPAFFVLKMATFIPLIIAPTLAWPLVGSHLKLIAAERALYTSATYDMLTGFLSRNAFFNNVQLAHELAIRNKSPLSIAIIDIDEFKKINDTHGHAAGDAVLKSLGVLIKNVVRKSDFIGRVGGDEFALVLPSTGIAEAQKVAENIRHLAANTSVNYRDLTLKFTLSIGISQGDLLVPALFEEVLAASDQALYAAKKSGRNCIVAQAHVAKSNTTVNTNVLKKDLN